MKHSEDYGHKTHTFLFRFDINKKKIPNTIYMKNEKIRNEVTEIQFSKL